MVQACGGVGADLQAWCEDDGDRGRWRGGADDGLLGESDGWREGRVKKLARKGLQK
jgi:hypothetical protein